MGWWGREVGSGWESSWETTVKRYRITEAPKISLKKKTGEKSEQVCESRTPGT